MIEPFLLVNKIVENYILPKIYSSLDDGIDKVNQKGRLIIHDHIKNAFSEYLQRKLKVYSFIDTLVFANRRTELDMIYEPLYLLEEGIKAKDTETILVDDYPERLFEKTNKIVLVDTAGMGKSTLLKKIFIESVKGTKSFPILIELSLLSEKNTIIDEICNQLESFGGEVDRRLVVSLIKRGDFIFLLDGYDEIAEEYKSDVSLKLKEFIEKVDKNKFILTSRPEEGLPSFGDFLRYNIEPLKIEMSYNLINRYDKYAYKKISKDLIREIEKQSNSKVRSFLINPLLVSLLYKSFEYKREIPLVKSEFYRQVFEALFETHDLSKDKYLRRKKFSDLSLSEFDSVLRYIAFESLKTNESLLLKDELLNLIDKSAKYYSNIKVEANSFLKDLLTTVPLFKQDGNKVKWVHKSIQDYFAAKFIWLDLDNIEADFFKKIIRFERISRLHNVFDIYYDLAPKKFEFFLLLPVLNEFKSKSKEYFSIGNLSPIKQEIAASISFGLSIGFTIVQVKSSKGTKLKISDKFNKFADLFMFNTENTVSVGNVEIQYSNKGAKEYRGILAMTYENNFYKVVAEISAHKKLGVTQERISEKEEQYTRPIEIVEKKFIEHSIIEPLEFLKSISDDDAEYFEHCIYVPRFMNLKKIVKKIDQINNSINSSDHELLNW